MIRLTRLNGTALTVNSDLICFMEEAPDTVLTLATGMKLIVAESCVVVTQLVLAQRTQVLRAALTAGEGGA